MQFYTLEHIDLMRLANSVPLPADVLEGEYICMYCIAQAERHLKILLAGSHRGKVIQEDVAGQGLIPILEPERESQARGTSELSHPVWMAVVADG